MTVYYVDSSVWVKRYYEETGTSRAQELFSGEHVLACSTLGLVEVAATLAASSALRNSPFRAVTRASQS
jgi:predicted nucleic acid-binding protein